MAFDDEQSEGKRIVLNLVADERFNQVVREAIAEICGRDKRFPSMPELLEEAIRYASQFSGAELANRTRGFYLYEPRKLGGVNLKPATHRRLTELMLRLNDGATDQDGRWSRRKLGVAALYAYSRYIVENNGQRYIARPIEGH